MDNQEFYELSNKINKAKSLLDERNKFKIACDTLNRKMCSIEAIRDASSGDVISDLYKRCCCDDRKELLYLVRKFAEIRMKAVEVELIAYVNREEDKRDGCKDAEQS